MRVLIVALLVVGAAAGQSVTEGVRATAEDFAFMRGCWEIARPERKSKITEQWMEPSGGTLIGMSRTVRDGKTTGYEFMRIEARPDGVYFISKPSGNSEETSFKLKQFIRGNAVFETPATTSHNASFTAPTNPTPSTPGSKVHKKGSPAAWIFLTSA